MCQGCPGRWWSHHLCRDLKLLWMLHLGTGLALAALVELFHSATFRGVFQPKKCRDSISRGALTPSHAPVCSSDNVAPAEPWAGAVPGPAALQGLGMLRSSGGCGDEERSKSIPMNSSYLGQVPLSPGLCSVPALWGFAAS